MTPYQVLLQSTCEHEAGWILTDSRLSDDVIPGLPFERHCAAGEILDAAAKVESGLGFRVAERLPVVLELDEVRAGARADERMPSAFLPVVVDVESQRYLPQRIGRFAGETRIGQSEVGAETDARRDVVLEQRVEDERGVELTVSRNERADVDTDGRRSRVRCAFLSRRYSRRHDARAEDEDSKGTFEHHVPP